MAKFKLSTKGKTAKVSTFGLGSERKPDPKIHGGKGAGLIRMASMGLPVPPGFVIQVENFHAWKASPDRTLKRIRLQVEKVLTRIEASLDVPMLFSVRSGAEVSMPGMMDTVLNVGAPATHIGGDVSERWALDCRRRFLQMFGSVVRGIPSNHFEEVLTVSRDAAGVKTDAELSAKNLTWVVDQFEGIVADAPEGTTDQIMQCIEAVFRSWDNPRAIEYRKQNQISDDLGTAVTIQLMVFGNQGETSGSGVAFSRCPSTGEAEFVVEYLANAQGEDVVAGIRTPMTGSEFLASHQQRYQEIQAFALTLEAEYKDMVDLEFTVEQGNLWILQVRPGKRSGAAAFKIAEDLIEEDMISIEEARKRLRPEDFAAATRPRVVTTDKAAMTGMPASPGVGKGRPVSLMAEAVACANAGIPFVWFAHETNPDHIGIMAKAEAIVTEVGGITSHAAVVARGMNKPCITGCKDAISAASPFPQVTVCGSTGKVWTKDVVTEQGGWSAAVTSIMDTFYQCSEATYSGPDLVMSGQVLKCAQWFRNPGKGQGARALEGLTSGKFKEVILDVSIRPTPTEDAILATALGNDAQSDKDADRRDKLIDYLSDHGLMENVSLMGLSKSEEAIFRKAGYRVVGGLSANQVSLPNLKAAIDTDTPIQLSKWGMGDLTPDDIAGMIPGLKILPPIMSVADVLGES